MDRAVVERLRAIIDDMERVELERQRKFRERIREYRQTLWGDCPHRWESRSYPDPGLGEADWTECLVCGGEIR